MSNPLEVYGRDDYNAMCEVHSCESKEEREMTTKHTPGPWVVLGDKKTVRTQRRNRPESDVVICDCGLNIAGPVSFEEVMANARLIAAAPELLAAADEVIAAWVYLEDDKAVVRARAIRDLILAKRKAEGGSE